MLRHAQGSALGMLAPASESPATRQSAAYLYHFLFPLVRQIAAKCAGAVPSAPTIQRM